MSSRHFDLTVNEQGWPLERPFKTARGASTEARVVVVTVSDGQHTGRGEAVPISRYGQNIVPPKTRNRRIFLVRRFGSREGSKITARRRRAQRAGLRAVGSGSEGFRQTRLGTGEHRIVSATVETALTSSLDTRHKMAAAAKASAAAPPPQAETGGDEFDLARVEAVRKEAPAARLLIDANESWSPSHYRENVSDLARLGVELIEQPFPADADEVLETLDHPVPVCADESCHTTADLPRLVNRYEAINEIGQNGRADGSLVTDGARSPKRPETVDRLHGLHLFGNRSSSPARPGDGFRRFGWSPAPGRRSPSPARLP